MPKRLTRIERQRQTRQELIAAAIRLFAERGVADVSVEAIAEAAGYSRGAYHSNFAGRDELLDAVVQMVVDELGAELEASLSRVSGALDWLGGYIRTFTAYCEREPARTRALVAVIAHRSMTGGPHYDAMVDDSLADLVTVFEQGQATGELRSFDPVVMARMLRRALDGEALRIAGGVPAAEIAAELVSNFHHATRAR